jgi:hypothetical protein
MTFKPPPRICHPYDPDRKYGTGLCLVCFQSPEHPIHKGKPGLPFEES